jgi:Rieske Fe-S protein
MNLDDLHIPRQQVIRAAGVVLAAGALAACAKEEENPAPTGEATTTSATAGSVTTAAPTTAGGAIAKTSDVPVGSGVIVGEVVITQPVAGEFKGLSAKCTHKGCTVDKVAEGTIDCPCHGSKFNLDGTVANGPAPKPLENKAISVKGDSIVLL